VLKKLIVALLACLTLFLSQRALTESRARSLPERQLTVVESASASASEAEMDSTHDTAPPAPATVDRTAVLY